MKNCYFIIVLCAFLSHVQGLNAKTITFYALPDSTVNNLTTSDEPLNAFEPPAFTVTATANTPFCGEALNLSAKISGTPVGAVTYSWSGPNNFTSTVQNPSFPSNKVLPGLYQVSVADATGQVSATVNVTIKDMTVFMTQANPTATYLCPSKATFTANVAGGNATDIMNYLWKYTGGTGSATAPTPSTATVGTTLFYVTQTTNGCPSLRVPITVNILGNPTTPVVISPCHVLFANC